MFAGKGGAPTRLNKYIREKLRCAASQLFLLCGCSKIIAPHQAPPPKMFIININDIISFLCKFAK
ncbi:MAG: hypothetical protein EGR33_06905 [Prevotella sp.]|nr:hypothetical protein [Prevotella sp.]